MKKLIICLLLVIGITNITFANSGFNEYHILCDLPTVKDIIINGYKPEDIYFNANNNLYIVYQRVDVKYESPITGNVIFVCKLKNTDKKIELPITISKFVNAGINDLKDFYFLPSFYFPMNASIYEWINYFNIITIENVLPGGN